MSLRSWVHQKPYGKKLPAGLRYKKRRRAQDVPSVYGPQTPLYSGLDHQYNIDTPRIFWIATFDLVGLRPSPRFPLKSESLSALRRSPPSGSPNLLVALLMPVSMPASSKEEYELLPSNDDHNSEPEHVRRCAIPGQLAIGTDIIVDQPGKIKSSAPCAPRNSSPPNHHFSLFAHPCAAVRGISGVRCRVCQSQVNFGGILWQ